MHRASPRNRAADAVESRSDRDVTSYTKSTTKDEDRVVLAADDEQRRPADGSVYETNSIYHEHRYVDVWS